MTVEILGGPRPVRLAFGQGQPEKVPCGRCSGCLFNLAADRVLAVTPGERLGGLKLCALELRLK